jgi:hypothetical protein
VSLLSNAEAVLRANWAGSSTVPSRRQYPHQWGWDAAFVAIGWSWIDAGRAMQELESILRGQWADGRVPHIVFNPAVPEDAYFPGPAFWASGEAPGGPPGFATSGLTQPPLHARAALEVARRAGDRTAADAFLRRVFPRLAAQHAYLAGRRDAGGGGLAAIVHPWESGLDDSSAWDEPLAAVEPPPACASASIRRLVRGAAARTSRGPPRSSSTCCARPRLFRDGLSRSDSGNYWSAGLGGSGSYVPYARSMPSPALSRTP